MNVLIVDDDHVMRVLLKKHLRDWGYEVLEAENGLQAWNVLNSVEVFIVITDWVMPVMDGLELCRMIRDAHFSRYIFIIMMTAKDSKSEFIEGMDAGADDFVSKPFSKEELKVRLRAGERIVKLEQDLAERNRKLEDSNARLKEAYSVIKEDLEAAGRIQSSLLPESPIELSSVHFQWKFLPAAFVAGDILNYFILDDDHVGFYLLDVAGHGIPAALLSVALSRIISPADKKNTLLLTNDATSSSMRPVSPADVMLELNRRFQADDENMQYFTMIYGVINSRNGLVTMAQAGHPSPVLLRASGELEKIGSGGFPIGMWPEMEWEEMTVQLSANDRLLIYSDGVTECVNKEGLPYTERTLMEEIVNSKERPVEALLANIEKSLFKWKGDVEFDDDITLLGIEFKA